MKRTFIDIIIIGLITAAVIISGIFIYGNRSEQVQLVIQASSGSWVYNLDTNRTLEIPGPLGNTIVEIENGEAKIIDSPCQNKTCIAGSPVKQKGDWNACLPNEVIIRVDGGENPDEVDVIAQ